MYTNKQRVLQLVAIIKHIGVVFQPKKDLKWTYWRLRPYDMDNSKTSITAIGEGSDKGIFFMFFEKQFSLKTKMFRDVKGYRFRLLDDFELNQSDNG